MAEKFDQTLDAILQRDPRYRREAYLFVREALDHTQKLVAKQNKARVRHVSGQELLAGIRAYGLEQFGPMAMSVFNEWGLQTCQDFGEIVFILVESKLLAKTDKDSRADFKDGYDFFEAFRRPFMPRRERAVPEPQPNPAQA